MTPASIAYMTSYGLWYQDVEQLWNSRCKIVQTSWWLFDLDLLLDVDLMAVQLLGPTHKKPLTMMAKTKEEVVLRWYFEGRFKLHGIVQGSQTSPTTRVSLSPNINKIAFVDVTMVYKLLPHILEYKSTGIQVEYNFFRLKTVQNYKLF